MKLFVDIGKNLVDTFFVCKLSSNQLLATNTSFDNSLKKCTSGWIAHTFWTSKAYVVHIKSHMCSIILSLLNQLLTHICIIGYYN